MCFRRFATTDVCNFETRDSGWCARRNGRAAVPKLRESAYGRRDRCVLRILTNFTINSPKEARISRKTWKRVSAFAAVLRLLKKAYEAAGLPRVLVMEHRTSCPPPFWLNACCWPERPAKELDTADDRNLRAVRQFCVRCTRAFCLWPTNRPRRPI